jgi:hypothetical protein
MTTTSYEVNRLSIASLLLPSVIMCLLLISSCRKNDRPDQNNPPSSCSSEVLDKWMTLQLRLLRNATGVPNQAFSRHVAYAGVAALESLSPGMPGHAQWSNKWNGLSGLPVANHSVKYYYPANVNAALAAINRAFFPAASITDKAAIDSLEQALNTSFLSKESQPIITASSNFGKAVATAVFNWAETDGYKNANGAYTPPTGDGKWKPTPPAMAPASTPYWGANRTIIIGSLQGTQMGAPLTYSTDPGSSFYGMVKQLYDASQTLTDDQKAMALFWRDVPGPTTPGHWLSIVQQVVRQTAASLDKAALAYALTGAAVNDALIGCFQAKYQHNLLRPVTYIREVMGQSNWSSFIGTPPHPEYASNHASLSSAAAAVLENLFGNTGPFTDHTNDYLGMAPRTYASFTAIGEEAAVSRMYGGIHFKPTVDASIVHGKKVAANILTGKTNY